MRRGNRTALATTLSVVAVVALSACGSSSNSSSKTKPAATSSTPAATSTPSTTTSAPAKAGGTVTLLMGTFPQSLDPGLDYTTQGAETNWVVYTGLTSYAHANGNAGGQLIPGLCTALPTISDGGKTYTCTLRKGLVFSNGQPVKASDFAYTMERSIKIPWGGVGGFVLPYLQGAMAYSKGTAKTISGITTDDATGQITMHLTQPYGPWDNVIAFPAFGLIPSGTPMKVEATNPPPGVGPYMVKNIVANQSFLDVPNPEWSKMNIPGIPAAKVSVQVKVDSNVTANALAVLNNQADFFDWADTLSGSILPQVERQGQGRFNMVNLGGSTYYVFMNTTEKPFNNQLAREAVVTGLNQDAFSRLGSGTLAPGCYFLPPDVPGHPTAPCPYGTPGTGDLAKAQALLKQSGEAGQPVTVWAEERSPRLQWMTYYAQYLNQLGFKATLKSIADTTYFTTIGESKTLHPQTGFADWNQDFPNPVDFYGPLLTGGAIQATNNENFGQVNDPFINSQVNKLGSTPTTQLSSVASQWQALDSYVAKKAYVGVFGYQKFPEFASSRVNYSGLVFHPIYGWDYTSFSLK